MIAQSELESYDYFLPRELIAQEPMERREESRLMILTRKGNIEHDFFYNISDYIDSGDTVVINKTKVLPAKLRGQKKTGGKIELLVFEKISANAARALVKGKLKVDDELEFQDFKGIVKEKQEGVARIEFDSDVGQILKKFGSMPLPPYIKTVLKKQERYQTVYAEDEGSVAAPTAGLHFSSEVLNRLRGKGVNIVAVTLHINIGTFLPIGKSIDMPEYFNVDKTAANIINDAMSSDSKVIVVGTSTYKCLESACNQEGRIIAGDGASSLFIRPSYEFKFGAHAFLTNFHLPKSSVLLLTCAYTGRDKLFSAYREAIERSYRFYSFGDSMLIFREGKDV